MQHTRFLRYADEVARVGSIRGAAERLKVAASAVNRRIQDLERELGTPIFERLPSGVRLTAAGEVFIAYARRRAVDLEAVKSDIEALRGLRRGRVAIAGSQAVAPAFLPRAIVAFQAKHPGVGFDVKVLDREVAVQAVLDFDVDLGLVFNPPSQRSFEVLAHATQRTCAVVAKDHPLAKRKSVRLRDCLAFPIAMPDASLSGQKVLMDLLARCSQQPVPRLVSNSFEMMRAFAHHAGGVSFQVEIGTAPESGVVAVPIEERGLVGGKLVLGALRGRVLPVAVALFADFLAQRLRRG